MTVKGGGEGGDGDEGEGGDESEVGGVGEAEGGVQLAAGVEGRAVAEQREEPHRYRIVEEFPLAPPLDHVRDWHDGRLLGTADEHDQDAAHLVTVRTRMPLTYGMVHGVHATTHARAHATHD